MKVADPKFEIRLAQREPDLLAAQRLRYDVFVDELGGDGELVDHDKRLERDAFDPFYDHLILIDKRRSEAELDHVIGVYRLLLGEKADEIGRFYSEDEYDLDPLKKTGRKLLELGRSCLHADYRGGMAMFHLWNGLAEYVLKNGVEVLFGVASFHGTDVDEVKEPLSYLYHNHLAPEDLRVRAQSAHYQSMNLLDGDAVDRRRAMVATPALIKAYLRLGGFVGDGAFIDHAFNTTDVCVLMDTKRLNPKQTKLYVEGRGA
ncbi:GNAT family N-acetyltransferase [Aliiroseovarius sp. YM-037]|uniref:GNAT family N-acetyltransferase n=1 Tax=Aliiroseovarius sp. YM-037 TaxID=3341728 RepID=UPI003A7FD0E8